MNSVGFRSAQILNPRGTGSISAENFTQMGGVVDLRRSKANLGGSLWSKHMILVNGSFRVQGSFSDGGGGWL